MKQIAVLGVRESTDIVDTLRGVDSLEVMDDIALRQVIGHDGIRNALGDEECPEFFQEIRLLCDLPAG